MWSITSAGARPVIHRFSVAERISPFAPTCVGMNSTTSALDAALAVGRGVLARSDHPNLVHAIDSAVKAGSLVSMFRGIYTSPEHASDFGVKVLALHRADPNVVFTGQSAAHLHHPAARPPETVTAASQLWRTHPGFRLERRVIPAEFIQRCHGVRVTDPALTALDLALPDGAAIDDALRHGVSLAALRAALDATPQRPGNGLRRRLLHDSRDLPWSPAERVAHRALREANVQGWCTNFMIKVGSEHYFVDLAFRAIRLAVEVDGWEHHGSRWAFGQDRQRDRKLAALQWHVVRFTASEIFDAPASFAGEVRRLVATRARLIG